MRSALPVSACGGCKFCGRTRGQGTRVAPVQQGGGGMHIHCCFAAHHLIRCCPSYCGIIFRGGHAIHARATAGGDSPPSVGFRGIRRRCPPARQARNGRRPGNCTPGRGRIALRPVRKNPGQTRTIREDAGFFVFRFCDPETSPPGTPPKVGAREARPRPGCDLPPHPSAKVYRGRSGPAPPAANREPAAFGARTADPSPRLAGRRNTVNETG